MEVNSLVDWPARMLEALNKIVDVDAKSNIDIKWQSDLYCHSYSNNTMNKMFASKKKEMLLKSQLLESDQPTDSIVLSHEKEKLGIKPDVLDETGFYVLDMENDEFLAKIDKIKDHLKKSDHPLNIFMKKFDDEFWSSY